MANEKRLIDANAFQFEPDPVDNIMNGVLFMGRATGKTLMQVQCCLRAMIDNAPTVDAVEVVHGYWIDGYNVDHLGRIIEHSIDCSVCDSVFKDDSRAVVKHWKEQFKVCPFCGAKMDGDGNG